MKKLMDASFTDLLEVDNRLDEVDKQIKHTKANPIISPAISEVDFHLPAQIREVTANPDGKFNTWLLVGKTLKTVPVT